MDQGGQERGQVDAAVVPDDGGQHRAASASRLGLQHGQLPAHPGPAAGDGEMVADVAA